MRKFTLLVCVAIAANLIALMLVFGRPGTATSRTNLPADPDAVSSIPLLPLHTLRPVY